MMKLAVIGSRNIDPKRAAKRKTNQRTYTKEELNEQSRQNRPNYNAIDRGRTAKHQSKSKKLLNPKRKALIYRYKSNIIGFTIDKSNFFGYNMEDTL